MPATAPPRVPAPPSRTMLRKDDDAGVGAGLGALSSPPNSTDAMKR